ncbi:MAG: hypothetical protein AABZ02_01940, partial [Bacteroidota bacterium]
MKDMTETVSIHAPARGATDFGNIHLADVREWYEARVRAARLEHVEPLWGEPPIEIVYEVIERGYRALLKRFGPMLLHLAQSRL